MTNTHKDPKFRGADDALTREQLDQFLAACDDRDRAMWLLQVNHGLRISEVLALTPDDFDHGYLLVGRLKGSAVTRQALTAAERPLVEALIAEREAETRDVLEVMKGSRMISGGRRGGKTEATRVILDGRRLFKLDPATAWRRFQKTATAIGLPKHKRHPHVLKHTCAMLMVRGLAPLPAVQKRLGHKSILTTMLYIRMSDTEADEWFEKTSGGGENGR